ncbi:MAG: 50S ribosome-binding GTPase [Planctomycetes bacterium]|nr:50S ribosome-binding GTPase [Planctomycetota bacterium]
MTSIELTTSGYCWLTPPAASALSLLFLYMPALPTVFDAKLAAADDVPRMTWLYANGEKVDQVVYARFGPGVLVSCHGGPAVRSAIEAALIGAGVTRSLAPDLWNGRTRLAAEVARLLPDLHGRAGVALGLRTLTDGERGLRELLVAPDPVWVEALCQARWLFSPPRIQLWGPVNAGKSSLLNALCGADLSAVADEPGLTRDVIEGGFEHAGVVFRVFDAPGEWPQATGVNAAALELARTWKTQADLVLTLVPPGAAGSGEWSLFSRSDEDPQARQPGVSVHSRATVEALKARLVVHFTGKLLALPAERQFAFPPALLTELQELAAGRVDAQAIATRWLDAW